LSQRTIGSSRVLLVGSLDGTVYLGSDPRS